MSASAVNSFFHSSLMPKTMLNKREGTGATVLGLWPTSDLRFSKDVLTLTKITMYLPDTIKTI
jgi:hypothetical protein